LLVVALKVEFLVDAVAYSGGNYLHTNTFLKTDLKSSMKIRLAETTTNVQKSAVIISKPVLFQLEW